MADHLLLSKEKKKELNQQSQNEWNMRNFATTKWPNMAIFF